MDDFRVSPSKSSLRLPLFTYLQRDFFSTPLQVHPANQGEALLFIFTTKEKAIAFRNHHKAKLSVVQLNSWLSVRSFLASPPDVDLKRYLSLDVMIDCRMQGPAAKFEVLDRMEFLEFVDSLVQ